MVGLPRTSGPLAPALVAATRAGLDRLLDATWLTPRLAPRIEPDATANGDVLRPEAKLYLAAVVVAAVAAALTALTTAGPVDADQSPLVLGLALAMILAAFVPIPFAAGTKLYFDTAILVAAVLLFPPSVALLLVTGSLLAVAILRRDPAEQALFNVAQGALQVTAGSAVLAVAGWRVHDLDLDHPGAALLAVMVGLGVWFVSVALVTPLIALQDGAHPAPRDLLRLLATSPVEVMADIAQVGLGIVLAAVGVTHGNLLALLLLPAGAIYWALAHHVRRNREAERRLRHRALHDSLTNLANRAQFFDRLTRALREPARPGDPVGVLYVDLDRFKFVNDSLGHCVGDDLLVALADRLRVCAPPPNLVARIGGDEFTVLLERVPDEQTAERIAAEIITALGAPVYLDGHVVTITGSIGVALAAPGTSSPTELLQDADVALLRAKRQGKARWARFDAEMDAHERERIAIEVGLRRALERGELRLVFQPIVDLATDRVVGMEALVRWWHPDRGLLPPDAFVPLAEETGLILPIGRWILEEACRQARRWPGGPDLAPVISVNLSARQFQEPALVEVVAAALRASGLGPDRLRLEITESAMMADADASAETLRRLRKLGVRIAIDDFGTGYSSLGYLQRFPVDLLKVDRSFVAGLGHGGDDDAIVDAMIGLAHTLRLAVVAEGVETGAQARRLRELGCEFGQGFHFGQPRPVDQVVPLILPIPSVAEPAAAVGD